LIASRFAKLHIISQLRSLNKEKKAAKTVSIIVGCFMVCWAPFFTVYLAEAFWAPFFTVYLAEAFWAPFFTVYLAEAFWAPFFTVYLAEAFGAPFFTVYLAEAFGAPFFTVYLAEAFWAPFFTVYLAEAFWAPFFTVYLAEAFWAPFFTVYLAEAFWASFFTVYLAEAFWAPFFTVYLAEAFCRQCTPAILFNIFFWLGYCNSAANPFIYGLCSRDFRYAFQKFLRCRYRRTKPALRHSANSQMMTMLQSLTMQVVAGGTVNAAANVTAANKRRRV